MITVGTFQTWAYYNSQLDYKPAIRAKLHIVVRGKTLCGRDAAGMETMSVDSWWNDIPHGDRCEHCNKAQHAWEVAGGRVVQRPRW